MALISSADQDKLRASFARITRPVRLLFFTQTLGCDTCLQARRILDELPALSDKITIEEVNFVLEPERARQYGIDRVPAIAVVYEQGSSESADPPGADASSTDSRIRFVGLPAGYEFIALVEAVLLAGIGESHLSDASRAKLASVDRPVTMQVFTTPTCPNCPRALITANEMAFASPYITTYGVEVSEFLDLARRYQVSGVPKTIVNEKTEILGALPETDFVERALAGLAREVSNSVD
jgi:glutaredoxin-like protein